MFPFTGLRLLLPAIVPSWRFFDAVTASPRVEYARLGAPDDRAETWHEFRPRAAVLNPGTMLRSLLWNPEWNENLYLVSLAERLLSATTAETERHSQRELLLRVARHLDRHGAPDDGAYLQIRLQLVGRAAGGEPVTSQIAYLSSPYPMAELTRS